MSSLDFLPLPDYTPEQCGPIEFRNRTCKLLSEVGESLHDTGKGARKCGSKMRRFFAFVAVGYFFSLMSGTSAAEKVRVAFVSPTPVFAPAWIANVLNFGKPRTKV